MNKIEIVTKINNKFINLLKDRFGIETSGDLIKEKLIEFYGNHYKEDAYETFQERVEEFIELFDFLHNRHNLLNIDFSKYNTLNIIKNNLGYISNQITSKDGDRFELLEFNEDENIDTTYSDMSLIPFIDYLSNQNIH